MADEIIATPAVAAATAPSPAVEPAPVPEVNELDQAFAFLNANGSKLDADGRVTEVNPAAVVSQPTAVETPVEGAVAAADPNATPEEELEEEIARPEANNFRVNLKDAADGERKRALIRLLKNEPGIDLAEAARRVGVSAAAATAATQPAAAANPAAPAPGPVQTLKDEITALERQEEAAALAFDQQGVVRVGRELRAKQAELVRVEVRSELAREAQAAQQEQTYDTAVNSSWQEIAQSYPDAGTPGTALHTDLSTQIASIHQSNPAFFSNPEWPAMLTVFRASKLGLAPKPAASAPAPVATPAPAPSAAAVPATVVARKPSTPAPPAPAPGRARTATPAPALAVPDTDDADELFAFLNAHGTRSP